MEQDPRFPRTVVVDLDEVIGLRPDAHRKETYEYELLSMQPEDILLAFHDVSVVDTKTSLPAFAGVAGFVKHGGITAVLGASSSGKSVLLKVLSGRQHELSNMAVSGDFAIENTRFSPINQNSVVFVPQSDNGKSDENSACF